MTIRTTSTAALIALSLGTLAAPAQAQQIQTFTGWGHEFWAPGQQAGGFSGSAAREQDVQRTGSVNTARYSSSTAPGSADVDATVPHSVGTINVWGARLDASN